MIPNYTNINNILFTKGNGTKLTQLQHIDITYNIVFYNRY